MPVKMIEGNIVQSFGSWIRDSTPQRSISVWEVFGVDQFVNCACEH